MSRNSWYMVIVMACLLIVVRHSSEDPLQYVLPVGWCACAHGRRGQSSFACSR